MRRFIEIFFAQHIPCQGQENNPTVNLYIKYSVYTQVLMLLIKGYQLFRN